MYVQNAAGRLVVNVGEFASSGKNAGASTELRAGRLAVAGDATLDGTLEIALAPGSNVTLGDTLTILTCFLREGTFSNVTFATPYLDNLFDVVYTQSSVLLVTTATTGVDLPPIGGPSDGSDGAPGEDLAGGVGAIPERFGLRLTSSNPFDASAGIAFEYDIPRGGAHVAATVFDASGRRIADLVNGAHPAGSHAERWTSADLSVLPSGVYFLRIEAGVFHDTKRLVLLR
jgi:hypothetical protein